MRTELAIKNRIALLSSRSADNSKIIAKLTRQLNKLDKINTRKAEG